MIGAQGGLLFENSTGLLYGGGNTWLKSVAIGDVDSDSVTEIVTAGFYSDGIRLNSIVCVWTGSTLSLERSYSWYNISNTAINSVALGDVDSDGDTEIVTGGYYNDGTRDNAQVLVLDGSSLAVENSMQWFWQSDARVDSVAIGDVDSDSYAEIVTEGFTNDFYRDSAQVVVLTGSNPEVVKSIKTWYWYSNTCINSVAIGDVDGDYAQEVVTGGQYFDGIRLVAQVVVLSGADVTNVEAYNSWYWDYDTYVSGLSIADVDSDYALEVVTGGAYRANGLYHSQVVVWSGYNIQNVESLKCWFWGSTTLVYDIAVANIDSNPDIEVVTSGMYFDGLRYQSQVVILRGENVDNIKDHFYWFTSGDTEAVSVAAGDIDSDGTVEFVTSGNYDSFSTSYGQVTVWSRPPVASLIWGTSNYPNATDEASASSSICQGIYQLFVDTGRYDFHPNYQGTQTQRAQVLGNISRCDNQANFEFTTVFYKGHTGRYFQSEYMGYPGNATWCPLCNNDHYAIYDCEGGSTNYAGSTGDGILDNAVYNSMVDFKHGFVFLWTCFLSNNKGGLDDGHEYGMPYAWMGSIMNSMNDNGYAYPDSTDRCLICFQNDSMPFVNATHKIAGWNYGHFAYKFYEYLLYYHYSIKGALDFAAVDTCVEKGGTTSAQSFADTEFYKGYDYTWVLNGVTIHDNSSMRVFGDGNAKIPS